MCWWWGKGVIGDPMYVWCAGAGIGVLLVTPMYVWCAGGWVGVLLVTPIYV